MATVAIIGLVKSGVLVSSMDLRDDLAFLNSFEGGEVKMKIKKRVIRAVAVSVVCILLAATLLFIGVAADTITLTAQSSASYSILTSTASDGLFYLSSDTFVFAVDKTLYFQQGNVYLSSVTLVFESAYRFGVYSFWLDSDILYVSSCSRSTDSTVYGEFFVLDISDLSSPSVIEHYLSPSLFGTIGSRRYGAIPFSVHDGVIYGLTAKDYSSSYFYVYPFYLSLTDSSVYSVGPMQTVYINISARQLFFSSSCFYYDHCVFSLFGGFAFSFVSNSVLASFSSVVSSGFVYEGNYYAVSSSDLYLLDPANRTFNIVGSSPGIPYASYASNGVLNCFTSNGYNGSLPYIVYTGLPISNIQIFSADSSGMNLLDSIPREGLISLSAFLGSTDNTSALKATYQDGTVLDLTFNQRFDGYAFGGDAPGSQVYPPVRNVWVDIPIDGLAANLFLLGDYSYGYVTVVDEGWGALVRLNYISPDNYIEFQFFEDSYRITTYSSDGSILYSRYEQESVKRWRFQINGVWREWTVYDPEVTDYFDIRFSDGVEAVMLDFTYVDSGGGDSSGDESDPESSVPDYSDPLWNGLFSGDPLEESKQNEANSRFDDYYSKAQAEQSLAGDVGDMIPDYSLQVDYAGDIRDQVDKWGAGINGGTSAKDMSNWLWSSLGCSAMFSVVMGGVLIRFILQTRA